MTHFTEQALSSRRPYPRRARGFTLVETVVVLAVAAVVVGAAAPSFVQARERRHLEGVAAQLETDLQLARSEAVTRSTPVRMSFSAGADASCYVVHTGRAGDCGCTHDGTAVCGAGAQALRTVRIGADSTVRLNSNSASIAFDSARGTVTPTATIQLQGAGGTAIHQVVNVMGRVRSCSPAPGLAGYKPC